MLAFRVFSNRSSLETLLGATLAANMFFIVRLLLLFMVFFVVVVVVVGSGSI